MAVLIVDVVLQQVGRLNAGEIGIFKAMPRQADPQPLSLI